MELIPNRKKVSKLKINNKTKLPKKGKWVSTYGPAPRWLMNQLDIETTNSSLVGTEIDGHMAERMCYAFASITCLNRFSITENKKPTITVQNFAEEAGYDIGKAGSPFISMKARTKYCTKKLVSWPLSQDSNDVIEFLNKYSGSLGLFRKKSGHRHPGHILVIGRIEGYWLKFDVWGGSVSKWETDRKIVKTNERKCITDGFTDGQAYCGLK